MHKKWLITESEHGGSLLEKILSKRGIKGQQAIEKFISGTLVDLYDPFMLPDMDRAVKRIKEAITAGEKILIYGDYDVDGITASALLYKFFQDNFSYTADYYLPNRLHEGYGLNQEALTGFIEKSYDLIITVDCGITALVEIEYAVNNGLDVIITDHHEPGEILPSAWAVINPKRRDSTFPFRNLAGVGVAYKLCQGLGGKAEKFLDIVALGSIADIVPLQDENRILVKEGINRLRNTEVPGLNVLIESLNLNSENITAGQVGYILAPPLNAAGRMEDPELGIKLLITDDKKEAKEIASRLIAINKERQQEEERIYQEALKQVESEIDLEHERCIVLSSTNWHRGVIGIVASRLIEKYYLPVVLIAEEPDGARGSCRSVDKVNIFRALEYCSELLDNYGGHAQAAGLALQKEKIQQFREKLNEYMLAEHKVDDFIPALSLDEIINPGEIDRILWEKLDRMKPHGAGNPRPVLMINDINLQQVFAVGKGKKHLKFKLDNGLEGIGFGYGNMKDRIAREKVDLAFQLALNRWNGKEEIQLNLKDVNFREAADSHPVCFKWQNWNLYDKRDCRDKLSYLQNLIKQDKRVGVYLNNNKKHRRYLTRLESDRLLFFSSSSALHKNEQVDELVLVSMPFSLQEMADMIPSLKNEIKIHLLYGREEYLINKRLIEELLPDRIFLRKLYSRVIINQDSPDIIYQKYNRRAVNKGLEIFEELELIDIIKDRWNILPQPSGKLDLSGSMMYNNIVNIKEEFTRFSELAVSNNLFELIKELKIGGR